MAKAEEDVFAFFAVMGLAVFGAYIFGYVICITLLVIGILILFGLLSVFGMLGAVASEVSKQQYVASEVSKQQYVVKREYDYAIRKNGGSIDGARMKFGDAEVYIEGPKNSFWKGMKYIFTGTEEYSTKIKIGGKEIGKIKVNSDGGFKFKWQ